MSRVLTFTASSSRVVSSHLLAEDQRDRSLGFNPSVVRFDRLACVSNGYIIIISRTTSPRPLSKLKYSIIPPRVTPTLFYYIIIIIIILLFLNIHLFTSFQGHFIYSNSNDYVPIMRFHTTFAYLIKTFTAVLSNVALLRLIVRLFATKLDRVRKYKFSSEKVLLADVLPSPRERLRRA